MPTLSDSIANVCILAWFSPWHIPKPRGARVAIGTSRHSRSSKVRIYSTCNRRRTRKRQHGYHSGYVLVVPEYSREEAKSCAKNKDHISHVSPLWPNGYYSLPIVRVTMGCVRGRTYCERRDRVLIRLLIVLQGVYARRYSASCMIIICSKIRISHQHLGCVRNTYNSRMISCMILRTHPPTRNLIYTYTFLIDSRPRVIIASICTSLAGPCRLPE